MSTALVKRVENPYLEEFLRVMEYDTDAEWWGDRWRPKMKRPAGLTDDECVEVRVTGTSAAYRAREQLVKRYAWAIPNDEALETIAALDRHVVEVGAGLGYWASRLQRMGVSVVAFDNMPGEGNDYCEGRPWTHVLYGDHRQLRHTESHHALLLCWPPYDDSMAADCLEAFNGDTLIYVGESAGGCTGDARFHEMLTGETFGSYDDESGEWIEGAEVVVAWQEVAQVDIPRWWGIRDTLTVYRR
jgi:hypothetical protein